MDAIYQGLGHIFTNLRAAVAAQSGPPLSWWGPVKQRMTSALIVRIWGQLHWIEARLRRAIARAAAGIPPRQSRARPRADQDEAAATNGDCGKAIVAATPKPPLPRQRKLPLPRREGWLFAMMPSHIPGAYGSQLRHLLADPELAPHLAHPSVVRILRPICRMLGITAAVLPAAPAQPCVAPTVPPTAPQPPAPQPPASPPFASTPSAMQPGPARRRRPRTHPPPIPVPT